MITHHPQGWVLAVVHSWSILVDLVTRSQTITEPFRYISVATRGISEPRERFANNEIVTQVDCLLLWLEAFNTKLPEKERDVVGRLLETLGLGRAYPVPSLVIET